MTTLLPTTDLSLRERRCPQTIRNGFMSTLGSLIRSASYMSSGPTTT
jgi:hypothetical protein